MISNRYRLGKANMDVNRLRLSVWKVQNKSLKKGVWNTGSSFITHVPALGDCFLLLLHLPSTAYTI